MSKEKQEALKKVISTLKVIDKTSDKKPETSELDEAPIDITGNEFTKDDVNDVLSPENIKELVQAINDKAAEKLNMIATKAGANIHTNNINRIKKDLVIALTTVVGDELTKKVLTVQD